MGAVDDRHERWVEQTLSDEAIAGALPEEAGELLLTHILGRLDRAAADQTDVDAFEQAATVIVAEARALAEQASEADDPLAALTAALGERAGSATVAAPAPIDTLSVDLPPVAQPADATTGAEAPSADAATVAESAGSTPDAAAHDAPSDTAPDTASEQSGAGASEPEGLVERTEPAASEAGERASMVEELAAAAADERPAGSTDSAAPASAWQGLGRRLRRWFS